MNAWSSPSVFGNQTSNLFGAQEQKNMTDGEVTTPPEDTVASMGFNPICNAGPTYYFIAGSWDNQVRCWQVTKNNTTNKWVGEPKAQQQHQGPVLDVAWCDDGTKAFTASIDKTVKMWDFISNQHVQVAQHDSAVKSVHWIRTSNYSCIMTASWDKSIKFWDLRSPKPIMTLNLPERAYCADAHRGLAVVSTADRSVFIYKLEPQPMQIQVSESPLKFQHRCVSIFCDAKKEPTGYALGSIEGRVAVQYVQTKDPKSNFTFKCHRQNATNPSNVQDIYAVNDIAFHPEHGTMATVGSDGAYSFWDKDARTRLKNIDRYEQSITRCCFNSRGDIFAYSIGYDWSKGHEGYNPAQAKNRILFHECYEDLRPKGKR